MAAPSNRKRRADGNYSKQITIGRKPDGKPIRKTFYAKTIKELEQMAAEYERQFKNGTLSSNEKITFSELAALWIETCKRTSSEKTKKRYESIIKNRLNDIGNICVKDLKPMHLQAILNGMVEEEYAKKTITEVKQAAAAALDFAMLNDIVFRNVFAKVSIPDAGADERQPLTDFQRNLVNKTWQGHRMGLAALLMMYCGLRRGELIALTWRDIDLKNKTIAINKAAAFYGNKGSLKDPKSKAGERTIPIPDAILPALIKNRRNASMLVCPSQKAGEMMSNTAFRRAWESYQHYLNIQAGGRDASRSNPKLQAVEPFTAHQMRHTYATMLYDAGVDVLTAQRLLGHADVQTTMKIYTHLSKQKEESSIAALNAHIGTQQVQITL